MILYHGTNKTNWAPHVGACFTNDVEIARQYGATVYQVEISGCTKDVPTGDRDNVAYAGDTSEEIAAYAAECDIITYADETCTGRQHRTWRVVDANAIDGVLGTV